MKFQMKKQIMIIAPAQKIWHILAHDFDKIGQWSSDLIESTAKNNGAPKDGAPMCGRVCSSSGFGIEKVEEVFTYYDEENMRFGYKGTVMPNYIKSAENNWKVIELEPGKSIAEFNAHVDINPLIGLLMKPYFNIIGPRVLEELKYFAENDKPHPRKIKKNKKKT